jgi:DNA-binding transcriptional regulator YbjK
MEYFDFIKQGDLDNLPEDNQLAFAMFVQIAQPRLAARLEKLDSQRESDWAQFQDARYGFQNVILGAARTYGVEPLASAALPLVKNYVEDDYRQFRADLSLYVTQIMLSAADQDRSGSVPLVDKTRQGLHTYVFHLREAIGNTDLPDAKKERLNKLLDDLERELKRSRVRIAVVAGIVMHILSAPGDLTTSYDAVVRITNSIMREIGVAKEADNEQRKVSHTEPVALIEPPRPEVKKKEEGGFDRSEMDDEIPF